MATYTTTTGRRVTAATREDAAALAAQYGLGELAGEIRAAKARPAHDDYVVWDDLCQCLEFRGTQDACKVYAAAHAGEPLLVLAARKLGLK